MNYKEDIKKALRDAQMSLYNRCVDIVLEQPALQKHGDISSATSLKIAKNLDKPPMEIASEIVNELVVPDYVDNIKVVKPGFINFYLKENPITEVTLKSILNNTLVDFAKKLDVDHKIIVEHTSVNPNKAMHVGHIRNAILGDSIARLLKRVGYKVEVQNYIDDTGVQVADTVNAVLNLNTTKPKDQKFDDYCWDIYTLINEKYKKEDGELLEKRTEILHAIENGKGQIAEKSIEIVNKIVDNHIDLMEDFQIYYDLLVHESDIIARGFWDKAFNHLKESKNFVYEDKGKNKGCWVLKFEDSKYDDKVLVRSDGTKVYTAKDIAYHMWKFGVLGKDFLYENYRKFQTLEAEKQTYKTNSSNGHNESRFGKGDGIINIIDERQSYPQEGVKQSLFSLGFTKQSDNYNHIAYGVVSLSKETAKALGVDVSDDKSSYTMSGRKGIGVKVTDLLDLLIKEIDKVQESSDLDLSHPDLISSRDIAIGAIKHYMLKNNPNTPILFDYKLALQLTGDTGPYLQYSHARAVGILEKAGKFEKLCIKSDKMTETERALVKRLSNWPDVIERTIEKFNMSLISEYAFLLSKDFHAFYEKNNVIRSDKDVKNFRLTVVESYTRVIEDVLYVMGIVAPIKM